MTERSAAPARRKRQRVNRFFFRSDFVDYTLIFIILFLVAFGLVMIYSTSSYTAELKEGDAFFYLKRQGIFALAGITGMFFISAIDYHVWKNISRIAIYGIIVLLIAVPIFGKESHGASRWLQIGSFQFQPSEVAKIVIILYTAHIVTLRAKKIGDIKVMLYTMILPMVAVVIIATQNLSTAIICAAIAAMIVFVTSPKIVQFLVLGGIMGAVMGIFLLIASYRLDRLKIWLDPEGSEGGYQTMQALYAIGSGGVFGKGLGQSVQKLGFIPESHNDYIFSVICEELGLFGAICVIAIFVLLIWRCVIIAMNAPDLYGALIVVGVVAHIAVQVIVNIAVVTNVFPPTGVPLPFISYGGTAVFCLLAEMGFVLSVSRQMRVAKEY